MSKTKFISSIIILGIILSALLLVFWFPLNVHDTVCNIPDACPGFVDFVPLYQLKSIIARIPTLIFKPHYALMPLYVAGGFVAAYIIMFTYRLLKPHDKTSDITPKID
jgi:hypothetical protein